MAAHYINLASCHVHLKSEMVIFVPVLFSGHDGDVKGPCYIDECYSTLSSQ